MQPGKASSNGKDSKAESPKKGAKASSPANSPAKGKVRLHVVCYQTSELFQFSLPEAA